MGMNVLMMKLCTMCFYHRDNLLFEQSVELPMINMYKSLSVQIKYFKTIIWFVPFMFHYTDYQPVRFCTYMAATWVSFHFFRSTSSVPLVVT